MAGFPEVFGEVVMNGLWAYAKGRQYPTQGSPKAIPSPATHSSLSDNPPLSPYNLFNPSGIIFTFVLHGHLS